MPRRLGSNSRRFGTLYRFHLHGQVDEEWLGWDVRCIYTWRGASAGYPHSHLYICLPLPQPVVTPPAPSGHSTSHWLRLFPTTTPSGINTPHVPTQSFFIHLPMKMEPIDGSETSDIRTKTPGNYPKRKHITYSTRRKLKTKKTG